MKTRTEDWYESPEELEGRNESERRMRTELAAMKYTISALYLMVGMLGALVIMLCVAIF